MKDFSDRLNKCSPSTRRLLEFLQTTAENAGDAVEEATYDGSEGTGVTYRRNGRRFCRFDPKHQADHVWAWIPGADRAALGLAGTVSERPDGPWVTVKNMRGAVRLVSHILNSYDAQG